MDTAQKNIAFLKSALTTENDLMPSGKFIHWMKEKNEAVHVKIHKIPFTEMRNWHFDESTGNLVHDTGRFFSIEIGRAHV